MRRKVSGKVRRAGVRLQVLGGRGKICSIIDSKSAGYKASANCGYKTVDRRQKKFG